MLPNGALPKARLGNGDVDCPHRGSEPVVDVSEICDALTRIVMAPMEKHQHAQINMSTFAIRGGGLVRAPCRIWKIHMEDPTP